MPPLFHSFVWAGFYPGRWADSANGLHVEIDVRQQQRNSLRGSLASRRHLASLQEPRRYNGNRNGGGERPRKAGGTTARKMRGWDGLEKRCGGNVKSFA